MNEKEVSIFDIMDVPRSYFTISKPKLNISHEIDKASKEKDLSLRKMAKELKKLYEEEELDKKTPHHNTIQQILSTGNYTIDNLLMVLDLLGKKIVITDRTPEEELEIANRGKTNKNNN